MPLPSIKFSSFVSKPQPSSVLSSDVVEEEDTKALLERASRPSTAVSATPSFTEDPEYPAGILPMPGTGTSLKRSTYPGVSELGEDWPYTLLNEGIEAATLPNSTGTDETHTTQMKFTTCSVSYLNNRYVSVHERFEISLNKGEGSRIVWQIAGVSVSLRAFALPLGIQNNVKTKEAGKGWEYSWELLPKGPGCQLFAIHQDEATPSTHGAKISICLIRIDRKSKTVTYEVDSVVEVEVKYSTSDTVPWTEASKAKKISTFQRKIWPKK
jgi:hypothetical protein